jgi:membrane protease YdiL (CAAX protease family)
MIAEARAQSTSRPLIVEILIWLAVFTVAVLMLEGGLQMLFLLPSLLSSDALAEFMATNLAAAERGVPLDFATLEQATTDLTTKLLSGRTAMILLLLSTSGAIAGVLIYVRAIERRRFATMGFRRGGALREYLIGLLVGAVMFSIAVGIGVASGALVFGEWRGFTLGSLGILALFFLGFMVQGLSEELLCRGYFMVSLARRQRLVLAVVVSSLAFAALHLANPGVFGTPFALINLAGFGVFAGVYILKRGSIWGAAAIHSVWNFVQGNIYGLPVSGAGKLESVFVFEPVQKGLAPLVNGGAFGPEGGLAVTIVLAVGIIVLLLMRTKPEEVAEGPVSPISPSRVSRPAHRPKAASPQKAHPNPGQRRYAATARPARSYPPLSPRLCGWPRLRSY